MPAATVKHPRIWGTVDPFVEGGPALGRRVANTTFLRALLAADPYDAYHFFLTGDDSGAALQEWIDGHFPALIRRGAVRIEGYLSLQRRLAGTRYHCMHLSDVLTRYTRLTRMRNAVGANIFPVTGLTHSLSYAHFMQEYLKHLWAGVSVRDAIMVTSESARLVMERVFTGLREAYGLDARDFASPKLVRLPLGVPVEDAPLPEQRWDRGGENNPGLAMRRKLRIGNETVFLYFGRICPFSKMDILPLFAALRRAEDVGLRKGGHVVILAGWVEEGDELPGALCSYAGTLGIRAMVFPRPDREERLGLYAAADVFVSPSDNIQETFGLTVAEASAAGLPVIASDFDGYRDIVVHERTGLLIPTLGFSHSDETELQCMFWYDNQYHFKLAQETVVDVPALAGALARLGTDAGLRARMGDAARRRIQKNFIWEKVIEGYVALWDELAALPLPDGEEQRLRQALHPQRMRFAGYFSGHFSESLDDGVAKGMLLCRTKTGDALYKGALPPYRYAGMEFVLDMEAVRLLLLKARKPVSGSELLRALREFFRKQEGGDCVGQDFSRDRAEFTLLWCLKQDYLERIKA